MIKIHHGVFISCSRKEDLKHGDNFKVYLEVDQKISTIFISCTPMVQQPGFLPIVCDRKTYPKILKNGYDVSQHISFFGYAYEGRYLIHPLVIQKINNVIGNAHAIDFFSQFSLIRLIIIFSCKVMQSKIGYISLRGLAAHFWHLEWQSREGEFYDDTPTSI